MKILQVFFIFIAIFSHAFTAKGNVLRDKTYQPEAIRVANEEKSARDNSQDISESDTGAQRPVILKKDGISFFVGYDWKMFYQSNPTAQDLLESEVATGVWKDTLFAGTGLGIIDFDHFILTPYAGVSFSRTDYLKSVSLINDLDYYSSNAYILFLAQFGNGWSAKVGTSYSSDYLKKDSEETFKEYYPNLSLLKSHSLNDSNRLFFETGIGYHYNEVDGSFQDPVTNLNDGIDHKRNFDLFASFSWETTIGPITLLPKYKLTYRDYMNGSNKTRYDLVHDVSISISAYQNDYLKLSVNMDYVMQEDSRSANYLPANYENFDLGANINLMARF